MNNIIVIGLGSMGKRRIRLMKENFSNVYIAGVDEMDSRRDEVNQLFGLDTYDSLTAALKEKSYDAAFICTSPQSHYGLISDCLKNRMSIFSELNLINEDHLKLIKTAQNMGLFIFLSSTLLYRREIQYIRDKVSNSDKKIHYHYHVGQYLPDWHPWERYEEYFVANINTNGCRELFAIELPWIIKSFGDIAHITVLSDKLTTLNLPYPDSYIVVLEHKTGHKGTINVDVVSRKATRNLEIISEELYLCWDGTVDSLKDYNIENKSYDSVNLYESIQQDSQYASNIIEDAYLDEIKSFADLLSKRNSNVLWTMEEEAAMLSIIDQIEGKKV